MPGATLITDDEIRAGSRVLSVFVNPLNLQILKAHEAGQQRFADLEARINWAAPTTLRSAIAGLRELGALEKHTVRAMPYSVGTRLTVVGTELLEVAEALAVWLERCPSGPIVLDSDAARGAVKALAGGWSSAVIRLLASRPQTLNDLSRQIPEVSYPTLERRMTTMRNTGQAESIPGPGRATTYTATDWLRYATAPLCLAGRYERRHLAALSAPITHVEVEAAFMLCIPLVKPPPRAGSCTLVVCTEAGEPDRFGREFAGVTVELGDGTVRECRPEIEREPETWALGTGDIWLEVVNGASPDLLRFGGADPRLAREMVVAIRHIF